jgi:hypothetical protein
MIDESTYEKMINEGAFDNSYLIQTGLLRSGKNAGKFISLLEFRYKETFETFFDNDRSKITKHANLEWCKGRLIPYITSIKLRERKINGIGFAVHTSGYFPGTNIIRNIVTLDDKETKEFEDMIKDCYGEFARFRATRNDY